MTTELGTSGQDLYDALLGSGLLELDPHEEALLLEACRVKDRIDALSDLLSKQPLARDGKPNGILAELRQQQLVFARLITALRLPEDFSNPDSRPQRRGIRGVYHKS